MAQQRFFLLWTLCLFFSIPNGLGASQFKNIYAIVIGHNLSSNPKLRPLKYADDDAVKYFHLLKAVATEVALFTEMDSETREMYPDILTAAPTKENILAQYQRFLKGTNPENQGKTLIFFVFCGHGDYDAEGRGFIYLKGGTLTQRELYEKVFVPSKYAYLYLVIDACHAALMVNKRGAGPYADRVIGEETLFNLKHFPNVGVMLSASGKAEVHEWKQYLSGIFSYEVRSGLLGTADLNNDQIITFNELKAYLGAANENIKNPIAKITPYIRGPNGNSDFPVMDLTTGRFSSFLVVDQRFSGKSFIEDENLVRYVDFNKTDEIGFQIALLEKKPYILNNKGHEYKIIPKQKRIELASIERTQENATRRGILHDYFERKLYETPFGVKYSQKFWKLELDRYLGGPIYLYTHPEPTYKKPYVWTIPGGILLLTGIGLNVLGKYYRDQASGSTDRNEINRINDQIKLTNGFAITSYILAGSALVAALVLYLTQSKKQKRQFVNNFAVFPAYY